MQNRLVQISTLAVIKKELAERQRSPLINLFERHSFTPRPGFDPADTKQNRLVLVSSYLDDCDWSDPGVVRQLLKMVGEFVRWNAEDYTFGENPRRDAIISALAEDGFEWNGRAFVGPSGVVDEVNSRPVPSSAGSLQPAEQGAVSMNPVAENALRLLEVLLPEDWDRPQGFDTDWFTERTGLRGRDLGAATSFLEDHGVAHPIRASGDGPADFGTLHVKPSALTLYHELKAERDETMRQGQHTAHQLPRLLVRREEAAAKIRGQVAEGERILRLTIRDRATADVARRERQGWTNLTAIILQTLTDSPAVVQYFTGPPPSPIIGSAPFRIANATDWHEREMGDKIARLEHILGELPYYGEPAESHPQPVEPLGKETSLKEPCVFIGHGRNKLWARLDVEVSKRWKLKTVQYEAESRVSQSIVPILEQMLDQATFAVLVLTAEDQTDLGTVRARQNVVHEVGLFQGRLGFSKVVLVMQRGVEEFSNLAGLQVIFFDGDHIEGTFYELQEVMKREKVLT